MVDKISFENSILSNSEGGGGYPGNLQQFRDLISAAGKLIGLTPSAVSKAISHTELQLGYLLFERNPKGLLPTQAAQILHQEAQAVYSSLNQVRLLSHNLRDVVGGQLRIGAIPSITHEFLPQVLEQFNQLNPHLEVQVHTLHQYDIPLEISNRSIDLALSYYLLDRPMIKSQTITTQPFYVAVRKDIWERATRHNTANPLSFLVKLPWIRLSHSDPMSMPMQTLLQRWNQPLLSKITVQTSMLALSLVRRGLGWTVIDFLTAANQDPQDITVISLDELPLMPLCWHALDTPLSPASQKFLALSEQLVMRRPTYQKI